MALKVEIEQLVNDLGQINALQPIIECITNSLEAKATNISIKLCYKNAESLFPDWFVDQVEVRDNGEGFNEKNFNAFTEYKTKNKIRLGCKGVGRLTWLKIYQVAKIDSIAIEDGSILRKKFTFDKNFDFKSSPQTEIIKSEKKTGTSIVLSCFRTENKKLKPIYDNPDSIRDQVLIKLLPKLILTKDSGVNFKITFSSDRPGIEMETIESNKLPALQSEPFEVVASGKAEKFVLKYLLPERENGITLAKKQTYGFYCADGRAVESFKQKNISVQLPLKSGECAIFLVESSVFNNNLNDARTKINLAEVDELFELLSWDNLNESLREILCKVIYDKWPELKKQADDAKRILSDKNPHLASYIKRVGVVGSLNEIETLKVAEKHLNRAKKQIRKDYESLFRKHRIDESDIIHFQELADNTTEVGKQELAEYIWYRKIIIDVMQRLIENSENHEKIIHNLIMAQYTSDEDRHEDNNLWLLDDKYSLYHYAASEGTVKEICDYVLDTPSEDNKRDKKRVDLAIFFSDTKEADNDMEAVIIELKSFSSKEYDKGKGLDQLPLYAKALREKIPKVKKIWLYLIVDEIDEDFNDLLTDSRGYLPYFSHMGTIYSFYNTKLATYITVISMESLIANAEARNHKFLQIVTEGLFDSELLNQQNSSDHNQV